MAKFEDVIAAAEQAQRDVQDAMQAWAREHRELARGVRDAKRREECSLCASVGGDHAEHRRR
jgi:hypothetical protein